MANFFKVGSGATDNPSNIVTITAPTSKGTADYETMEFPVGTDYQVPSGKTLYITKLIVSANAASADFAIGYGDTGVANGVTAPTNFVQITPNRMYPFKYVNGSGSSGVTTEHDVWIPIPQLKFPCARSNGTAGAYVTAIGILV